MSITQSGTPKQKPAIKPSGASGGVAFYEVRPQKLVDLVNQALDGLNRQGTHIKCVQDASGAWSCVLDAPAQEAS